VGKRFTQRPRDDASTGRRLQNTPRVQRGNTVGDIGGILGEEQRS
jgi:hypothetical protein